MLRPGPHREGEEPKPMMYERGKSDFAIRAVKPANKAERSAAELVEQRAGTKGNADQQSTRRAQERESVSQALDAYGKLRSKGRRKSSPRSFTTSASGCSGWRFSKLRRTLRPGVDGLTWQDYE